MAVIARMTSIPAAFGAGIAVGVAGTGQQVLHEPEVQERVADLDGDARHAGVVRLEAQRQVGRREQRVGVRQRQVDRLVGQREGEAAQGRTHRLVVGSDAVLGAIGHRTLARG